MQCALSPKNIRHPKNFYVCSNSKIRKFEDGFSKFWKFEKRSSKFWNIRKIGRGQMNGAYVLYVLEISLVIRIMHLSSKILFDITFLSTCNRNKKHKCWLRYFLFMTLGYLITYEKETKVKSPSSLHNPQLQTLLFQWHWWFSPISGSRSVAAAAPLNVFCIIIKRHFDWKMMHCDIEVVS